MMMIVVDVWGGPRSQEHLARFIRDLDAALELARRELLAGYLVNLRGEVAWGGYRDFDERDKAQ